VSATAGPVAAGEVMAPDLAARVTAFARACKSATRSVALYPGEHPAVAESLEAVKAAADAATAHGELPIAVVPDALTVHGRAMARPDPTVAEFAGILHRHQVGQLSIRPGTDAGVWRRFLALLALPPDQARLRGGLGKLWASEGETRVELRIVDYNELLRSRLVGDRATWAENPCTCGRAWPLLQQVDGRVLDAFTTPGGGTIDGCYFTMGFFGLDWLEKFQVIQETPDLLRVFIVPRDPAASRESVEGDLAHYDEHVRIVLGPTCRVEYEFVDAIAPSPQGKHRYTISRLAEQDAGLRGQDAHGR